MSNRLRSLDSKISFFAFADIITAVSGILIFITLMLATDLGRPVANQAHSADPEIQSQLEEALRQQQDADAENRRLQELLTAAETAPAPEKIESDISRLRSQLAQERQKQSALTDELAKGESALRARDQALGLTDLKATIEGAIQDADALAREDAKARSAMASLEQQVAAAQSRLLKLISWAAKVWLIPDKSDTTKEPLLVTVGGSGAALDRLDHPEQHRQLDKDRAESAFDEYLHGLNPLNQYVVFLVRPSGIELFNNLVQSARGKAFEVGFDALEEDKQVNFSATPPPLPAAEPATPQAAPPAAPPAPPPAATPANWSTNAPPPAAPAVPPAVPQKKGWWQRLKEWAGFS